MNENLARSNAIDAVARGVLGFLLDNAQHAAYPHISDRDWEAVIARGRQIVNELGTGAFRVGYAYLEGQQ